jgi:hypothetical protein
LHIAEQLPESRQAIKCTSAGVGCNIAALRQTRREPHGFFVAIDDRELPVAQLAYDHMKTVGAEIYGANDFRP